MGTLELSNLIQLEINENLRNISIPKKGVVFGVDGDIEVNRVAFVFPRYYSNFDMTEFSARVNYVNANGEANYYEADDMSSDDGDTATFSWLMTSDVTSYIGEVRFSVLLYKRLDERYVKKFGTRPATGRVLEGLDVESYVTPEQQLTLIEKMEKKIDAYVEAKMLSVNHDIEDAKNGALDAIEEAKNDVDSFIASSKSEIDSLLSSSLDDIKNLADTSKLNISTLTDEKLASLDKETVRQLKNIELAGVEETEKIRTAFSSAVSDIQAEGQKQADAVDSHGDSKIKEINDSTATSLANINSISEKQVEAIQLEGTKQASSVSSEGNKQVSTVVSAGTTEVTKVKKASSTALSDIGSAKESSISEITAKGTEQVKTIKDTSASEISKVQETGISQVKSVSDEGKIQIDGVKSEGEKQVQSVSAKGTQSLQDIDTAKTAAVKSVNDQTKPIIDKVEQLKQNVNDKSDSVDEAYEQMKKLHCIEISEETPTNERAGLWVNPESNEEINIPEIKDEEVSDIDTWSSQKINHEIDSLKEDLSNKITKFYASNQGENHLADSDDGKIQDMMICGRSEQKQYKGINLFPPNTGYGEFVEVSIPKGTKVFAITDGTNSSGGNFRFFNADKTESMWFGIDKDTTMSTNILNIDAKYAQNLIKKGFDLSKICLGIGNEPIYEPYVGGQPSPSPDYPQQIKSVGDGGSVAVKVTGKNLLNPALLNSTFSAEGISAKQNSDGRYTISGTPIVDGSINTWICGGWNNTVPIFTIPPGSYYSNVLIFYYDGKNRTSKQNAFTLLEPFRVTGVMYSKEYAINEKYNFLIAPQLEQGSTATSYSPYREQLLTLPTPTGLLAIPVASGGNVTINGQQYIADYVDIERGKAVRIVDSSKLDNTQSIIDKTEWLLAEPQEIDLATEQITAFKELATYYPVTNISVNSDQLDGYTVFNYPISMAEGWNYIKQQLNDNRDYIYDMDAKAQDIDTQAAEAYVNSEYAVALTELEV